MSNLTDFDRNAFDNRLRRGESLRQQTAAAARRPEPMMVEMVTVEMSDFDVDYLRAILAAEKARQLDARADDAARRAGRLLDILTAAR